MSGALIALVALLVLGALLIVVIAVALSRRNTEQKRARAEQLRLQAATQDPSISQSREQAADAEAQAQLARQEAERAERRAAEARQGMRVDEARQEDAVREADRIDPDVDHRSDGYEPGTTKPTDPS
jgi:biopolymer transport protein ExbB/TolQ